MMCKYNFSLFQYVTKSLSLGHGKSRLFTVLVIPSCFNQVPSELLLFNFEPDIKEILSSDDKDKFISFFRSHLDYFKRFPSCLSTIIEWICSLNAVNCAIALIDGETSLRVDVNHPVLGGYYPLHLAARNLRPYLVKLFIDHGAQTNIMCDDGAMEEEIGLSPLSIALKAASIHECLSGWTPTLQESSIYELIILLCMPEMKDALDANKLLAQSSDNLEAIAYHYAKAGKLIEFAILLIVAREKVLDPITFQKTGGCSFRKMTISQYVNREIESLIDLCFEMLEFDDMSGKYKKELNLMRFTWWLLKVFKRAGHDIEKYLQSQQPDVPKEKARYDVHIILCKRGFFAGENVLPSTRKPARTRPKQSECGAQELQVQLPSKRTPPSPQNNIRCISNIMSTLSPPGTESLSSAVRSIHTNRVSKSLFGFQCSKNIVFPVVMKRSEAIEQHVPEFLSGKKWAYFASMIKRGIRRA